MKVWRVTGEKLGLVAGLYLGSREMATIRRNDVGFLIAIGGVALKYHHFDLKSAIEAAEKIVVLEVAMLENLAKTERIISRTVWNIGENSGEFADDFADEIADGNANDFADYLAIYKSALLHGEEQVLAEMRTAMVADRATRPVMT